MKDIFEYIEKNVEEYIADLQLLIQQPSISAQNIGLRDCANLVKDLMHKDGLPAEFHDITNGPPLVFGHLKSSKSKKTLLCYSHYDVQPPEPIEEWSHGGPWSGALVDNIIYGRGGGGGGFTGLFLKSSTFYSSMLTSPGAVKTSDRKSVV